MHNETLFSVLFSFLVFKAKEKVISSSQLCSKFSEELIAEVDYAKMTFSNVTRHRMESKMKVDQLQRQLEEERAKFPKMKKEGKEVCVYYIHILEMRRKPHPLWVWYHRPSSEIWEW